MHILYFAGRRNHLHAKRFLISSQLILMIIEKYAMHDLRIWTNVSCLNKTFYVVAKIERGPQVSTLGAFFPLALITLSSFVLFPKIS